MSRDRFAFWRSDVLTNEDLRRFGATTVPEALRVVPGLHIAQETSNIWAVGARGFSSGNSAKLLVLSDTRSIYTPFFSGADDDERALSSFALLLACGGFLGYELLGFQASLVNELTTEAEVVAFGLATPLLFDDEVAADSSLQALQATPRSRSAVLTKGGKVFATFGKAKLTPVLPGPPSGGAWHQFERERVLLSVPVLSEGRKTSSGDHTVTYAG
jgi:hypothetical protein